MFGHFMFGNFLFGPYLLIAAIVVIPFWRIFQRAGFPPALSLLMLVPFVNLVMIYYLAFSRWPSAPPPGTSREGR